MKRKQTIKEWELETGIRVNNPKGFRGQKSKLHTNRYTKEGFRLGLEKSVISVKTEKGLLFLEGKLEKTSEWRSFVDWMDESKKFRKRGFYHEVSRTDKRMQKNNRVR